MMNILIQLVSMVIKSMILLLFFLVYTKAAEMAQTDGDKSAVLTALAMVLYKFGDLGNAKTNLFQR
jgi:hypothetical protein